MSDPVEVLYFYRTKWGAHDEFVELFKKNHWPILREQLAGGRFTAVEMFTPRFHGDGRADWDILVSITFRDWASMDGHSDAEIATRLFKDQKRFRPRRRAASSSSRPTGTCRSIRGRSTSRGEPAPEDARAGGRHGIIEPVVNEPGGPSHPCHRSAS